MEVHIKQVKEDFSRNVGTNTNGSEIVEVGKRVQTIYTDFKLLREDNDTLVCQHADCLTAVTDSAASDLKDYYVGENGTITPKSIPHTQPARYKVGECVLKHAWINKGCTSTLIFCPKGHLLLVDGKKW